MSTLDVYLVATGKLSDAEVPADVSCVASDRLAAASNDVAYFSAALERLVLNLDASKGTTDWLTARIAQAEAEKAALTEALGLLVTKADAAKSDDAAAATAAVAVVP